MSVPCDLVGRLAQLRGIVSKPELNEAYVLIQAYLPEKDRFSVQKLPSPSFNDEAVIIAVRLESLALCTSNSFLDKYPRPSEVQVVSKDAVKVYPDGTTLKLSKQSMEQPHSLVLEKSHRIVGVKSALNSSGIPDPEIKYFGNLHVAPTAEDAIVEIEDIHFVGTGYSSQDLGFLPTLVLCFKGKFTTFRRCVFDNVMVMVSGNAPLLPTQNIIASMQGQMANVVFENCVIGAGVYTEESIGISAGVDGTVTLLNCVVRNRENGVLATAGSKVVMKHCTVQNCVTGVAVVEKTRSIDLLNCSVLNNSQIGVCGILVNPAGPVELSGCRVENCKGVGILLRGKSKHVSRVAMNGCHVSGCHTSVCIERGELAVSISATCLQKCECGLAISPAVIGRVAVNACNIRECKAFDIINTCATKGLLTIDGVVQEADPLQQPYQPPEHLSDRRCGQRAGICDINCLNCGKKEETGEKFKKCGKCEDVCYCSRECQKTHWKEHKKTCTPRISSAVNAMCTEMERFREGTGSGDQLSEAIQRAFYER